MALNFSTFAIPKVKSDYGNVCMAGTPLWDGTVASALPIPDHTQTHHTR